jgi:hypothetical protein
MPIFKDIDEDEAQDEDQWLSDIETTPPSINTLTDPDDEAIERYIRKMNQWQNLEYSLNIEQKCLAEREINNVILNMELLATNHGIPRSKTGTATLTSNSKEAYEKHFRGIQFLICLIKDWESALVLADINLEFCPSMKPETIVLYLKWRTEEAGTILEDSSGMVVEDID